MSKKFSILIVDDDADLRGIYAYNFKGAGFDVHEANDGLEGLNFAKQNKVDVIFTGIMMPNMDGFELLKLLKDNVDTSSIPVLISSHLGKEEDRKKSIALGATKFLVKGMVSPIETVKIVKDVLTKKIYKIVVHPEEGDAEALTRDLNIPAPISLHLIPTDKPHEFNALIIHENE